jgi:hypothetical protein
LAHVCTAVAVAADGISPMLLSATVFGSMPLAEMPEGCQH